jgi:hypothetical protein
VTKDFIHLDETLVSSKPLTRFVGPRFISQENLMEKVACRYFQIVEKYVKRQKKKGQKS